MTTYRYANDQGDKYKLKAVERSWSVSGGSDASELQDTLNRIALHHGPPDGPFDGYCLHAFVRERGGEILDEVEPQAVDGRVY